MDGTKFISIASKYQGADHEDLLHDISLSSGVPDILPIGTVLTLPATGSEMNSGAVISQGHAKYVVKNPKAYPVFSFLDPTLTYTLPPIQVANGIIDTFVHVCEQYVTYPVDGRFQDRTAEGILETLIEIGRQNIDDPTNYEARANLVWNATMALNGLIGAGVVSDWSTHMIGHELTAFFGIDHAQTLAIIMPTLWEVRKDKKRDKLLQYAERVWHIDKGSDDDKINTAISKTRAYFESLGVKTRLSDYGIKREELEQVIDGLKAKGMTKLSETRDLSLDIVRTILEKSY